MTSKKVKNWHALFHAGEKYGFIAANKKIYRFDITKEILEDIRPTLIKRFGKEEAMTAIKKYKL